MRDRLRARMDALVKQFIGSPLAQKASGSMILTVVSKGLTFVTGVVLARAMSTEGFGYYNFAEAYINLFCFLAMLGMNILLTREVSQHNELKKWSLLRGLLRWSDVAVGGISIVLAIGAAALFYRLRGTGEYTDAAVATLIVAMIMVPLMSLMRIRQAAVLGFGHIVSGQLPQMLIRPGLFLVLVGLFWYFGELSGPMAYLLRGAAALVALIVGILMLRRYLPAPAREAEPSYRSRVWMTSGVTLMASGFVAILNQQLSTLLVGNFLGGEATAIFNVAKKGAEFITFVPAAIYLAIGPTIASKYAAGDLESLQRVLHKTVRYSVLAALIPALLLLVLGKYFLLLHGPEYMTPVAMSTLIVLVFTFLLFVTFGPSSLILNMTGFERYTALWVVIATIVNAVATLVLMRYFGVVGAAVAQLITMLVYKVGLTVTIYRMTNLRSFIRFF